MADSKQTEPTYHSYHELRVWQKAVELLQTVYQLYENAPPVAKVVQEKLLGSALILPALIANGHASRSKKEYVSNLKECLRELSLIESIAIAPGTEGVLYMSLHEHLADLRKMLASLTSSLTKPKKEDSPSKTE